MNDRFRFRTPIYRADGSFKGFVFWEAVSGFPAITAEKDAVFKEAEQCTGLKDKNGRLIFEGDFFRPNIAKEKEKVFGIITFGKYDDFSQSLGFYVKWKGYPAEETEHGYKGWRKDLIFWLKRGELEIIGNIHENADVLEEENETDNSI